MSGRTTVLGKTALRYLDQYPNMATLTLAKLILRGPEGHLFDSVERARSVLRDYRGSNGKHRRKDITVRTHLNDKPVYNLPESDYKAPAPLFLSSHDTRIGLLPDLHIPFHDSINLKAALDAIAARNPTTIIITGDLMDCYKLSMFDQNPDEADMALEVARTKEFLGYLRNRFKKARCICMEGNHEVRLKRWTYSHPEMFPILKGSCTIPKILDFNVHGVEWVEDKQIVKAGPHLSILHGHEMALNSCGVSPARAAYLKAKECVIVSHLHRASQNDEVSLSGKVIASWSLGCLCGLKPLYLPINNWSAGAGFVELSGKDFDVTNLRIINGEVKNS